MSIKVPKAVQDWHLTRFLVASGLVLTHMGKVCRTYALPGFPDLLLVVASDCISIFDFVLMGLVPTKGMVLTAMKVHWFTTILKDVPNHLVAYGVGIDRYLPGQPHGSGNKQVMNELYARSVVIRKLDMIPVECIYRGNITGSVLKKYLDTNMVYDYQLESGLYDGAELPQILFTPTTKEESGHDKPIPRQVVRELYGPKLEERGLNVFEDLRNASLRRGTIMADSKFEFGYDKNRVLTLGDEAGTPDSSRFYSKAEWDEIQSRPIEKRGAPTSQDKEFVRTWGKTIVTPFVKDEKPIVGINKLDPLNDEHVTFVHSLGVPSEILLETSDRYHQIFQQLTGQNLHDFHRDVMEIH